MDKTETPKAIHHSHQCRKDDLWDTIMLYADDRPDVSIGKIYNSGDRGWSETRTDGEIEAQAIAIADKIVRAYNCHDLLVAAIQELGDWLAYGLEKPNGAMPTEDDERRCAEVAAKARFALEKAKGADK